MKWLLSTPSNTATARRFLSSLWGHDLNIKQMLRFVFFRQIFQGWWNGSRVTMKPNVCSKILRQLIGVLTLMFSAGEVYYLYSFPPIYSSFHHCFCREKVLFLYVWWRVSSLRGHYGGSCRKLWSNTVARNYCKHYSQCSSHSEVDIMRAYFPRREREGEAKRHC